MLEAKGREANSLRGWVLHGVVGVLHRVVGVLHRVIGVLHMVVGVLHTVVGVSHRVVGVLHRVLGVLHRVVGDPLQTISTRVPDAKWVYHSTTGDMSCVIAQGTEAGSLRGWVL